MRGQAHKSLSPTQARILRAQSGPTPHFNYSIPAPLSIGRTVLKYRANDALLLSFKNNEEVKILSKGSSYWGIEVPERAHCAR
jgi:hypothetical protein